MNHPYHRPVQNFLLHAPKGVLLVSHVEKRDAPPTEAFGFQSRDITSTMDPQFSHANHSQFAQGVFPGPFQIDNVPALLWIVYHRDRF